MTKLFTVSTLLWLYIALLHSTFRLLVLPSPVVIRNGGSGLAPSDTLTHLARFRNRNKQSGEIDHLTMWYCSNRNGRVKMGLLAGRVIILLISRLKAIIDSEYSIYSVAHQSGHVFCVYGRTVGVHGIVGSGKIVERGFGTTFQNCACWLWSYRMRWAVWMVPAECTRFFFSLELYGSPQRMVSVYVGRLQDWRLEEKLKRKFKSTKRWSVVRCFIFQEVGMFWWSLFEAYKLEW